MGPRRTTLTYSSEDAPPVEQEQVFVYYCKYSGKHALTTNCNLNSAPRRRADHSLVVDTTKYTVRLYTTDGGVKHIRRQSGDVEEQHRLNVGKLAIAYKTEPEGRYLYILDNAVTTYSAEEGFGTGGKQPVPPCIMAVEPGITQLSLELDDRGKQAMVLKVSADYVRVQIRGGVTHPNAGEELLELMRGVLGVRLSQLSLSRGESARHKVLRVSDLSPDEVFEKIKAALGGRSAKAKAPG